MVDEVEVASDPARLELVDEINWKPERRKCGLDRTSIGASPEGNRLDLPLFDERAQASLQAVDRFDAGGYDLPDDSSRA